MTEVQFKNKQQKNLDFFEHVLGNRDSTISNILAMGSTNSQNSKTVEGEGKGGLVTSWYENPSKLAQIVDW